MKYAPLITEPSMNQNEVCNINYKTINESNDI